MEFRGSDQGVRAGTRPADFALPGFGFRATRWSTLVSAAQKSAGYVTKFAPHGALELIS